MCRRTRAPSFTETAIAEPLLVDTNILIGATDTRRRFHGDAMALIDAVGALVFPAQVIREYLVVATGPVNVNGLGMSPHDALENIGEFRKAICLLAEERPFLPAFLRRLAGARCCRARGSTMRTSWRPPSFIT